ncbi:MAG: hypothetical protein IPK52_19645 [Chloroflexi bacterium]|nr:hypothetical protein [Chloroflexota bacterium]
MAVVMSQEELAYLLRLNGRKEIRAAALDLAEGNPQLEAALYGAAERTLRARGWIVADGDTLSIEKTVIGTVGFCASAPYTLAVRRTPVGDMPAEGRAFHLSPALQIVHSASQGIHVFDVVEGHPTHAIMDAMHGGVGVEDLPGRTPILDIPLDLLIIAAGAARKDDLSDSGVIRLLTDSGATPDAASALTALYRGDWLATVSLGIWSPGDEGDNYSPLDLLQGRSGWWILLPSGGAGRVNVQPASLGDVQTIIDQAVNTATTAAS